MPLDLDALEEEVDLDADPTGMSLSLADTYVSTIKANNADINRYKEIYNQRVKELKEMLDEKVYILEQSNERLSNSLNEFAKNQDDLHTTKTKHKLNLLSGTIEISREVDKINKPNNKSLVRIKETLPEFFVEETKTEEKFAWADLKKQLKLQDGKVYYTDEDKKVIDVTDIIPPVRSTETTKIV